RRLALQAECRWRVAGGVRDVDCQDACVPRTQLPGGGADARPAGRASAVCVGGHVNHGLAFDIAHMLAGGLVLASFMMLYQDRLYALLHVLALHALVLACAVAWQAHIQHAPQLYITATIALGFKAMLIPWALRRIVFRLGIHREIETVVGIGVT